MAGSPYASALGRLRPEFPSFLGKEMFQTLLAARDPGELAKLLETTPYAADVARARTTHPGPTLLEVAINRTFVRRCRHAFEATPFAGRPVVAAYLGRWDVENVELILSSKAQGRAVGETEDFLVSSREIPAGLYAGVMTLDDFRQLLAEPTLDSTVTALVRYGYGAAVLPLVEAFQRTRDIFPILHALDRQYYRTVLESARFFQGDEWVVRELVASEIDLRNILLLLKGKQAELPLDAVVPRWLDGGTIPNSRAGELYAARTVPELADHLVRQFPSIGEGAADFAEAGSLRGYEVALQRDRAVAELKRLLGYPLSLAGIFAYLLRSELERADLRKVAFGKLYGLPHERLAPLLVSLRL